MYCVLNMLTIFDYKWTTWHHTPQVWYRLMKPVWTKFHSYLFIRSLPCLDAPSTVSLLNHFIIIDANNLSYPPLCNQLENLNSVIWRSWDSYSTKRESRSNHSSEECFPWHVLLLYNTESDLAMAGMVWHGPCPLNRTIRVQASSSVNTGSK